MAGSQPGPLEVLRRRKRRDEGGRERRGRLHRRGRAHRREARTTRSRPRQGSRRADATLRVPCASHPDPACRSCARRAGLRDEGQRVGLPAERATSGSPGCPASGRGPCTTDGVGRLRGCGCSCSRWIRAGMRVLRATPVEQGPVHEGRRPVPVRAGQRAAAELRGPPLMARVCPACGHAERRRRGLLRQLRQLPALGSHACDTGGDARRAGRRARTGAGTPS